MNGNFRGPNWNIGAVAWHNSLRSTLWLKEIRRNLEFPLNGDEMHLPIKSERNPKKNFVDNPSAVKIAYKRIIPSTAGEALCEEINSYTSCGQYLHFYLASVSLSNSPIRNPELELKNSVRTQENFAILDTENSVNARLCTKLHGSPYVAPAAFSINSMSTVSDLCQPCRWQRVHIHTSTAPYTSMHPHTHVVQSKTTLGSQWATQSTKTTSVRLHRTFRFCHPTFSIANFSHLHDFSPPLTTICTSGVNSPFYLNALFTQLIGNFYIFTRTYDNHSNRKSSYMQWKKGNKMTRGEMTNTRMGAIGKFCGDVVFPIGQCSGSGRDIYWCGPNGSELHLLFWLEVFERGLFLIFNLHCLLEPWIGRGTCLSVKARRVGHQLVSSWPL